MLSAGNVFSAGAEIIHTSYDRKQVKYCTVNIMLTAFVLEMCIVLYCIVLYCIVGKLNDHHAILGNVSFHHNVLFRDNSFTRN